MALIDYKMSVYSDNQKFLIIFPDIPYQLLTNEKGVRIFSLLKKTNNMEDMRSIFKNTKPVEDIIQKINIAATNSQKSVKKRVELKSIELEVGQLPMDETSIWLNALDTARVFDEMMETSSNDVRVEVVIKDKRELSTKLHNIFMTCRANSLSNICCEIDEEIIIHKEFVEYSSCFKSLLIQFTSYENIVKSIICFRQLREKCGSQDLIISFLPSNDTEMRNFLLFCKKEGIYPSISMGTVSRHTDRTDKVSFFKLVSQYEHIAKEIDFPVFLNNYNPLTKFSKSLVLKSCRICCNIGCDKICIAENGDVYSCIDARDFTELKLGNVFEESMLNIWNNSDGIQELRELNVDQFLRCNNCDVKYFCAGQCRMLSYSIHKNLTMPAMWCEELHDFYIKSLWNTVEMKTNWGG